MEKNNFMSINDVSKELSVSRLHLKMLAERDYINTFAIDNTSYVTLTEFEKIKEMFKNNRIKLNEIFEDKERIQRKAVEEIASLLD